MSSTRTQSIQRHQVVVLFADISDSSRFYRELGDAAANALVTDVLAHLAISVTNYAGEIVDQIGDELMCTYPKSAAAICSAVELQRGTREFAESNSNARGMEIRIGLHAGDGLEKDGKPVGDTVYVAKRLTDQAKAGQILLSKQSMENFPLGGFGFRALEEITLKGQAAPTSIYEIVWDRNDATVLVKNEEARSGAEAVGLQLVTPGGSRHHLAVGESITVGRSSPAQLVIDHTAVSRLHARIEGRKGRFVLTDVSTNGSFVQSSDDKELRFVRRDDFVLIGSGMIGFGRAPIPGAPNTLNYRCITD